MNYRSTRGKTDEVSASKAIITGLAPDGGLFVPKEIPAIDFKALAGKNYCEIAQAILQAFLPEYNTVFLQQALENSYGRFFNDKAGYLHKVKEGVYSLELWHGPTAAFKDYALQLMPKLLVEARNMNKETDETLILVATSGDTGGAALAGYANLPGVKIAAFYPVGGTSEIQRLQMETQEGDNVFVYAVHGNFDDAQRGVKQAFNDTELKEKLAYKNKKLSSANSINWGRLVPQIVYYVTSYLQLCNDNTIAYGDELDFCVPSGNFGDIMAGYYAKAMGLPIGKLICASNQNNVLAEFLKSGHFDARGEFYKTSSPSMDVLISSNLERLLYHESGNSETVGRWMDELAANKEYTVDEETLTRIQKNFVAGWATEENVDEEIKNIFTQDGYLCDPHTAVAFSVLHQIQKEQGRTTPTVVLSTASPFKFSEKVLSALESEVPADAFDAMEKLAALTGEAIPASLAALNGKTERFNIQIEPETIVELPLKM